MWGLIQNPRITIQRSRMALEGIENVSHSLEDHFAKVWDLFIYSTMDSTLYPNVNFELSTHGVE